MDFAGIAKNRLLQAAAVAGFQVLFSLLLPDFHGLLAGFLAGQLMALWLVQRRTPELRGRGPADGPSSWQVARDYAKMPLVNGPTAVLDAVRSGGISVLIGNIALSGLGQFTLAFQITKAPVSLINGAIAQVMLQRLAATAPGGMSKILRVLFARIALLAVPAFAAFYAAAPRLFPLVFGDGWEEAGLIARALVPWLFMVAFTSPLSSLFVVTGKQEWALAFAVLSTASTLGFLVATPLGMLQAVTWLAWIMAGLLALWVAMAVMVARAYDRTGQPRELVG